MEIQRKGSTQWILLPEEFTGPSGGSTAKTIDLLDFAGMTVRIGFRLLATDAVPGFSDESWGWWLDDIIFPAFGGIEAPDMALRTQVATNLVLKGYSTPPVQISIS